MDSLTCLPHNESVICANDVRSCIGSPLNPDPLDLIKRDRIARMVIELGGARAFVRAMSCADGVFGSDGTMMEIFAHCSKYP